VLSNYESLKNSKKFLVIHVIAQLYYSKSVEVKGNQVNFILFIHNRKDYSENIVRDISFYNKMNIRDLIYKNRREINAFSKKLKALQKKESNFQGISFWMR